jgi:hypothetical protein
VASYAWLAIGVRRGHGQVITGVIIGLDAQGKVIARGDQFGPGGAD